MEAIVLISLYGYIYISAVEINPSTYFGGQWEQLKDVFLLMDGDIYQAGSTGGEASHKLTTDELPSNSIKTASTGSNSDGFIGRNGYSSDGSYNFGGQGQAHNNMPPYLTVYGYKKIA